MSHTRIGTNSTFELNDQLRVKGIGGEIVLSQSICHLGALFIARAITATQAYNEFTPLTDPVGEHDFGFMYVGKRLVYWKIEVQPECLRGCSMNVCRSCAAKRVLKISTTTDQNLLGLL